MLGGGGREGGIIISILLLFGGGVNEGYWGHIWPKNWVSLTSECLAADLSADASADALCIINIGHLVPQRQSHAIQNLFLPLLLLFF